MHANQESHAFTHGVSTNLAGVSPLSPGVLREAGVSLDDALWLTGLSQEPSKAFLALQTDRGQDILSAVRGYVHAITAPSAYRLELA